MPKSTKFLLFSHNSGSKFLLAKFLLNIQTKFPRVFTNYLRVFYIFSKTLIQYFLNCSKNVATISKIHSTFLRNIPRIFLKRFYNFFRSLPYIFYNARFIYKICFLVLEPSSNLVPGTLSPGMCTYEQPGHTWYLVRVETGMSEGGGWTW